MMGRRSTWTIRDDDQLRVLAATGETSALIAMRLKRSAPGIRKRAKNLGIVLAGSTKAPGQNAKGK
jgi:3-deoxy-D-manno-octulosonate 8-phosphate phosphatase KdsC-like HAD superfamily phosphatase